MKRTKKLTVAAILVALCVVILSVGSLVEVLDLCTVFVASLMVAFAVAELGSPWQWLVFAASAVLSVLLVPNKYAAWEYALVVGVLPILKQYWERLPRPIAFLLKFVSFNILFAGVLCLFLFALGMPLEPLSLFGVTVTRGAEIAILAGLANLCFFIYDYLLTALAVAYGRRIRPRFARFLDS